MNKNKSFTLIELLVVIVIIGILAGVIMISTSSSIDKAHIAKSKVFEESVANDLAANMVSRWKLDDIIETNKTSDTWGSNTGTLVGLNGLPSLRPASECVTDHCFKFDGEDDYIDFGDILRPSRTGHRTFSFWAKLNSFGGTVFSTGNLYHSKRGYSLFQPKNKSLVTFSYELHNSPYKIDLDCDMELNQWMFFIVSIKPNSPNITFYLYKDGILKDVRNEAMTDSTQIYTSFKVGVNNHGPSDSQVKEFLNGYVDDFKVFNAIFSEAQIKQNYIAGLDSLLSKASISKEDYNERINTLAYDN